MALYGFELGPSPVTCALLGIPLRLHTWALYRCPSGPPSASGPSAAKISQLLICPYVCMCVVCVCVCVYVCMDVYTYVCMYARIHVCMYHTYVVSCVCMYTYVYTCYESRPALAQTQNRTLNPKLNLKTTPET